MPQLDTPVMELLRDSTADLHKAAESHAMQRDLVKGALPVARYADYLEQLLIVHRALERALVSTASGDDRLAGLEEAASMHVRHLETDLAEMGRDPGAIEPTNAAQDHAHAIERDATTDPILLAGHFYVLEGSMNGNQFIARAVKNVYGLTPDAGLAYLCSYGEAQRPTWTSFKERMNATAFTADERAGLVERAGTVFHTIRAIADELDSRA